MRTTTRASVAISALMTIALCSSSAAAQRVVTDDREAHAAATPVVERRPVYDATELINGGTGALLGGWLGGILLTKVGLLVGLATVTDWPRCDFCEYYELWGLSFVPIVGPSIWGTLFLERGNYIGLLGLVSSAAQLAGTAMLIAGAALHYQPSASEWRISISPGGASATLAF